MRPLPILFALTFALALPGCTWFGGADDSPAQDDPDPSTAPDTASYTGGPGVSIVVHNKATDRFNMGVRVLGAGNAEVGRLTNHLVPGETSEKWISISQPSIYSARLNYTWSTSGSASQGVDEQTFDSRACPEVTRLEWDLRQSASTVGHLFVGKTCVTK